MVKKYNERHREAEREPRNKRGEFEHEHKQHPEHHMHGHTRDGHEMYAHRRYRHEAYGHEGGHHAGWGTMELGIPSYDGGEPFAEELTPMRNVFSQFQKSASEVIREGARTSAMENDRANKMRYSDNEQYDWMKQRPTEY